MKSRYRCLLIICLVCAVALVISGCKGDEAIVKLKYVVPNDMYDYDACFISFDANGGSCDTRSIIVFRGGKYGELPVGELDGCDFIGWFTERNGGEQINSDSILAADATDCTLYAKYKSRPGQWNNDGNSIRYTDDEGKGVKNSWRLIDDYWYRFDDSGEAVTGWYESGSRKYYFEHDGKLATGFRRFDGNWYYFTEYPFGSMTTGWTWINNKWYFFDEEGKRHTGWIKANGLWYYTNKSGVMQTDWQEINGVTYYFDEVTGKMYTGWSKIKGNIYYFDDNGALVRDTYVGDKYLNGEGILEDRK